MKSDLPHILVVDDDTRLRALLRRFLVENGFRVSVAEDAANARAQFEGLEFDLVILDRMMPGEDGLTLAAWMNGAVRSPILMLTAMGETDDRIAGLEAGVEDYLPKPFEPRELLLRCRAILRRIQSGMTDTPAAGMTPDELRIGAYRFDTDRELLIGENGAVRLTSGEAALLKVLAEDPGAVFDREELAKRCQISGGDRSIDVQVTRLRRKLEPDPKTPRYLQTVRGQGYVLRPD